MSTCFPSVEITAHSQKGNSHATNEDSWGSFKNLVWVIDGASNPKTTSGEVVSFVNALNTKLKNCAANNPHASLASILAALPTPRVQWSVHMSPYLLISPAIMSQNRGGR